MAAHFIACVWRAFTVCALTAVFQYGVECYSLADGSFRDRLPGDSVSFQYLKCHNRRAARSGDNTRLRGEPAAISTALSLPPVRVRGRYPMCSGLPAGSVSVMSCVL